MGLSRQIAGHVQQDKHLKLQRYEIFIDKMQRLYKSEMRYQNKVNDRLRQQENAVVFALTPLKEILATYVELSNQRGFNQQAAIATLNNLGKAVRARGLKAHSQGDYTVNQMDQSWRMSKLIEDVKYALRKDQFFSAHNLAELSQTLGQIGYKNTELIPMIVQKLETLVDERLNGTNNE
jgi:hypothetical protein